MSLLYTVEPPCRGTLQKRDENPLRQTTTPPGGTDDGPPPRPLCRGCSGRCGPGRTNDGGKHLPLGREGPGRAGGRAGLRLEDAPSDVDEGGSAPVCGQSARLANKTEPEKKKKKTLHFFLFFKSLHIKRIFKRGRRRRRRRTNKRKKREGERDIGIWRIETARGSCKSSWWVRRLRLAHDAWLRFPLKSRCVCKEDRTWGG